MLNGFSPIYTGQCFLILIDYSYFNCVTLLRKKTGSGFVKYNTVTMFETKFIISFLLVGVPERRTNNDNVMGSMPMAHILS